MSSALDSSSDDEKEKAHTAQLPGGGTAVIATFKDPGPLGLEFASRKDGCGVLVFRVHVNSRAAACRSRIRRGMRLAGVNGSTSCAERVSVDRVGELIRNAGFPLTLTFHPAPRSNDGARHAALLTRIQRRFRWRRRRRREGRLAKTAEVEAALRAALKPNSETDKVATVDPLLLLTACYEGRADDVRLILSSHAAVDVNAAVGGCTPLFVACQNGRTDVVTALLELGTVVDAGGYCCFVEPKNQEEAKTAANENRAEDYSGSDNGSSSGSDSGSTSDGNGVGERINTKRRPRRLTLARKTKSVSHHSAPPLLVAAAEGHARIVEMLLSRPDVDVNATSAAHRGGATALYIACQNGHADVVSLLLHAKGIKIDARSGAMGPPGITPSDIATHCKHKAIAVLIETRQAELAVDAARRLEEATCKTCGVDRRVEPRCPCTQVGWLDRRPERVSRAKTAVSPVLLVPPTAAAVGPLSDGRCKRVGVTLPPLRRTPSQLKLREKILI